jgi:hypothetical protein
MQAIAINRDQIVVAINCKLQDCKELKMELSYKQEWFPKGNRQVASLCQAPKASSSSLPHTVIMKQIPSASTTASVSLFEGVDNLYTSCDVISIDARAESFISSVRARFQA